MNYPGAGYPRYGGAHDRYEPGPGAHQRMVYADYGRSIQPNTTLDERVSCHGGRVTPTIHTQARTREGTFHTRIIRT